MAAKLLKSSVQENLTRLRAAFMGGVSSVQPQELIEKYVTREGDKLLIDKTAYTLNENVYVVGFGKAVIGMIRPIENILKASDGKSHIKAGVLSVPYGIQKTFAQFPHLLPTENSKIEISEGAKDNIPDEDAFASSKKIVSLVEKLKKEDLLLILISGGGSALLPYPLSPLTLEEKSDLVKALSRAGATITELNTVRKALSATKGGKLAQLSKATVVSFILSDVINSPLDIIASGPTVVNCDSPKAILDVLEKYKVTIPDHVSQMLDKQVTSTAPLLTDFSHVTNIIIGSNESALRGTELSISYPGGEKYVSVILSSTLNGEASHIGRTLAEWVEMIVPVFSGNPDIEISDALLSDLCISMDKKIVLKDALKKSSELHLPLWVIFGGETTVHVQGSGRGGRNQEMVLSFSINIEEKLQKLPFLGDVLFLSGGTDGIDGPTDAAGALTYYSSNSGIRSQLQEAHQQGLVAKEFLSRNDSYTYFSRLNSGKYLLQPGHTGTNVMDVQILMISPTFL